MNLYFIIAELINGIRLDEITPDETIYILEKVLLILDKTELSGEERNKIMEILKGDDDR